MTKANVSHLESGTGRVICVGLNFDGFLEHDAERGVCPVRQKRVLVRAECSVRARLEDLNIDLIFAWTVNRSVQTEADDKDFTVDDEPKPRNNKSFSPVS